MLRNKCNDASTLLLLSLWPLSLSPRLLEQQVQVNTFMATSGLASAARLQLTLSQGSLAVTMAEKQQ